MPESEARWFKIISFVVTGIIAGVLLADIIYFNELRRGKTLSSGEVTSMLIISGVLFAITIIMFIWSLIRLFVHKDTRDQWSKSAQDKASSWAKSTDTGFTQDDFNRAGTKAQGYYNTAKRKVTPSQEPPVPANIPTDI